jgi:hypothetical protein
MERQAAPAGTHRRWDACKAQAAGACTRRPQIKSAWGTTRGRGRVGIGGRGWSTAADYMHFSILSSGG